MYKISLDNLNKILQYLATRPYAEVFQLISLIQSLEIEKEEKVEEKAEDIKEEVKQDGPNS